MFLHVVLAVLLNGPTVTAEHELVGQPAAQFTLSSISGKKVSLKQFRGKIVVLNFWATWCGPCKKELPEFVRMRRKYKDRQVEILTINVDSNIENARRFLRKNKLKLKTLWDGHKKVAQKYDVQAMPSTYVIDQNGVIRSVHKGFTPNEFRKIQMTTAKLLRQGKTS